MADNKKLAQFTVDEFLRSEIGHTYTLTTSEVALLMALGNRITNGADCYPSQEYLANYLRTSIDTIKRNVKKLVRKNLIKSFRKPSRSKRYKFSRHNYYVLSLPVDNAVIGSTMHPIAPVDNVRQDAPCHLSPGDRVHHALRKGAPCTPNRSFNKSIKENREREATPSLVFEPDEESLFLVKDLGLNLATVLDSFENRCKRERTQYEFRRWCKDEKAYLVRKGAGSPQSQEPKRPTGIDFTAERMKREAEQGVKAELPPTEWVPEPMPEVEKIPYRSYKELQKELKAKLVLEQGALANGNDKAGTNSR